LALSDSNTEAFATDGTTDTCAKALTVNAKNVHAKAPRRKNLKEVNITNSTHRLPKTAHMGVRTG
jgi:hypothetical protein